MRFLNSPRPIRSVLIANRGEIAVRIMHTCSRLGLRTIAVYSDADKDAVHVRTADQAVRIGPAPSRTSYLDMAAVIGAAEKTGADAIHPGYGFLSENAAFARQCESAGIIFIGPSVKAVERMGSKIESKRIAEAAGVATVPGYHGGAQDSKTLAEAARQIGYPVLIKASAGGGGRGMRRVDRAEDFTEALAAAKAEANSAFGDDTVLLEKFILNPRHLEVQLAGDRHGGLVHLFERDCSVQRNNQKLLEEAPAPDLSDKVRTKLYQAALKLGHAIGYDSAGTVEFIMEQGDDAPYFLEMNTRLQVEHPVTELITGIDLVEWQFLAAAGELLPLRQEAIQCRGHAIEARLTAERADLAFQPVTGRLVLVEAPGALRLDSGVTAGSDVGLYYDSLLAKLIAHGPNRNEALTTLSAGLAKLVLLGMPTIQPFLHDAVRHPIFAEGKATTRFIETAFPSGWKPDANALARLRALAAVTWANLQHAPASADWSNPWNNRNALRVNGSARPGGVSLHAKDEYGEAEMELRLSRDGIVVEIDGHALPVASEDMAAIVARRDGDTIYATRQALALSVTLLPIIDKPRETDALDRSADAIVAPLHGAISIFHVAVGDLIERGTPVMQMEAMKLVHTLKAPMTGRIKAINYAVGDIVPAGAIIVEISPEKAEENI